MAVNQIKSEWKRTPWLGPGEVQLGMGRHDGNVACPPAAQGVALFQKPWPRDAVSKRKAKRLLPAVLIRVRMSGLEHILQNNIM